MIQAIRAIAQDRQLAKSNHIMYAYNFIDRDGVPQTGYFDDGEWTAGSILSSVLRSKEVSNAVLIVTRKFGGVHLGKKRFELLKHVANEVIELNNK